MMMLDQEIKKPIESQMWPSNSSDVKVAARVVHTRAQNLTAVLPCLFIHGRNIKTFTEI